MVEIFGYNKLAMCVDNYTSSSSTTITTAHFVCQWIFASFRRLIILDCIHFGWNELNKCRFHVFKLLVLLFLFYRCSLLRPFKIIIAILAAKIANAAAACIIYLFISFFPFPYRFWFYVERPNVSKSFWCIKHEYPCVHFGTFHCVCGCLTIWSKM